MRQTPPPGWRCDAPECFDLPGVADGVFAGRWSWCARSSDAVGSRRAAAGSFGSDATGTVLGAALGRDTLIEPNGHIWLVHPPSVVSSSRGARTFLHRRTAPAQRSSMRTRPTLRGRLLCTPETTGLAHKAIRAAKSTGEFVWKTTSTPESRPDQRFFGIALSWPSKRAWTSRPLLRAGVGTEILTIITHGWCRPRSRGRGVGHVANGRRDPVATHHDVWRGMTGEYQRLGGRRPK